MATVSEVPDEPGQPPALSAISLAETSQESKIKEQIITPFDVSGGVDEHGKVVAIDYNKLIDKFGSQRIDTALLERFEKVTGRPPHRLLRRGMVFSHRDLNIILDKYEKGIPFYLYTGRGPSSDSMHVGHSVPFEFTKYLQDAFNVPLIIMLTDDEKFFHSPKLSQKECYQFALRNALDIIAIGFDIKKTFIFADTEFIDGGQGAAFNHNIREMGKKTTTNQIKGTFGFTESNNILEFAFPATQSATSFATSFPFIFGSNPKTVSKIPCLIPCAIDQDPYFRQCRDNAPKLNLVKPALIHTVFLPSLRGSESKMSASDTDSSIFLSDTDNQIKKKIGKAFSGGQDTKEEQERIGGRTAVDVPFQYLTFFLESDEELEDIRERYESGKMQSGDMKAIATRELQAYVAAFRERRKAVTEEVREEFMTPRQLVFRGMPVQKERKAAREEWKKSLLKALARVEKEADEDEKEDR
ncbi:tryptophan--tRNA ligase [Lecanora helva]